MTQDLIIAVLLLGLTGLVWAMTLATFTHVRSPRKDPSTRANLPDGRTVSQNERPTETSQGEA